MSKAGQAHTVREHRGARSGAPGLLQKLADTARNTALGERVEAEAKKLERRALKALKTRLLQVDPPAVESPANTASPPPASGTAPSTSQSPEAAAAKLAALLERSQAQSKAEARSALIHRTLDSLTPDEARMLSALSDGKRYPLLHVQQSSLLGGGLVALENASTLGRAAGARMPECTSLYVTHLYALGLLRFGAEDPTLEAQYEILQTEAYVMEAINACQAKGGVKLLRRSLVLSDWGKAFWEFCNRPGTFDPLTDTALPAPKP